MTGDLLALLAGLFFAAGSLFARSGSDTVEHRVGLFLSLVTNASALVVAAAVSLLWRGHLELSALGAAMFALGGVSGTLFGRWAAVGAIHRLGPSRSAVYKSTQPLLTTVLAVLLLHEPFAPIDLAGGALVMAGVLTSVRGSAPAALAGAWDVQPGQRTLGIQLGLLSAFGYAIGNLLRKVGIEAWPEPLLGAAVGVLVALLASSVQGSLPRLSTLRRPFGRGELCFAAFGLCSAGAQLSFLMALQRTPVWIANVFVSMEPVLTLLLSALLFRGRERLTRAALTSVALVLAGSLLIVSL